MLLGHDEVEDSDFSVQPGRRWLRFVDPETGSVAHEVDLGEGPEVGRGRASVTEDMMVLSMRQGGCTWLEFRDLSMVAHNDGSTDTSALRARSVGGGRPFRGPGGRVSPLPARHRPLPGLPSR